MADSNIKKLFRALIGDGGVDGTGPIQDLERAFIALITERRVTTAVGKQLDDLGNLVGEPRLGDDDDDYRPRVRARIAVNNSDGVVEDVINVVKLLLVELPDAYVHLSNVGNGVLSVSIEGVVVDTPLAAVVLRFAQAAVGAGVRVLVEYEVAPEDEMFTFEAFPGEPDVGLGFESFDGTTGGVFAGALSS